MEKETESIKLLRKLLTKFKFTKKTKEQILSNYKKVIEEENKYGK